MKLTDKHTEYQGADENLLKGFRKIPPEFSEISKGDVFREFWSNARSEKGSFIIILTSVLLQGGVAGGSIFLLKFALDQFFEKKTTDSMLFLIAALFLATVFKSALEFLFKWKKSVAMAYIYDKLVVSAFGNLLFNPFRYHINERDRTKYSWVLKDSMKFIESFFGIFNSWAKQPFILISTLTALWVISPMLTFIGICLIPFGIPCVLFLKRKIKEFVAERKQLLGVTEEMVAEGIRSIRIVKVFGLEERNIEKLRQTLERQREINNKNAFYLGLMSPLTELLGFFGLTVIVFAGGQDIIGGAFTTGTFFVFIMAFLNIYSPLKDISNGFLNYQLALDAGKRLIILRQRAINEQENKSSVSIKHFKRLHIENLWFSYKENPINDDDYVLRNLSLTIQKGERVALVGATGAGKSTLCDLIFRLYQPQRGRIAINGNAINNLSKENFTSLFSLCSQDTIVFNNTLFDEIRIARPEASRQDVQAVASASGLSDYLRTINRSLDSWVGDRGVQFSGGQKQMIALARALLKKPQVLILDEAMSGFDLETSREIWDNIGKILPDCTLVVISHNWDIIKNCQKVMMLANGGIVKTIQVEEIKNKNQFFKEYHFSKTTSLESDPFCNVSEKRSQLK